MKIRPLNIFLVLLIEAIVAGAIIAQDTSAPIYPDTAHPTPAPNSDQYAPPAMNQNTGQNDMPVFRVTVSERTTKAVNYRNRGGSTMVDFRGTDLLPGVEGHAKVDSKNGPMTINIELKHMPQAHLFGGQFLTYVLWAITPEGRAVNLGEVVPGDSGKDKLQVTTDLQAFGLIVTAEPYYAVTYPSNKVVAENILRDSTKGFEEPIDAKFDVLEGGQYTIDVPGDQLPSSQASLDVPLDLLEARNALAIAKAAGAQQYATDSLTKAEDMLQRAEDYYQRKQGITPIGTAARGATQMAEDARVLTLRREREAKIEADRRAPEEAEARERLARISGIVLAYPDLKLEIDGYTDAIGSDDYNQTLSDKRAEAVRDYLVNAGVSMNNVVARGLGKSDPVADNTTAAGRQLNRRVEMIVSGDVIGTQLNPNTEGGPAQSTMNRQ